MSDVTDDLLIAYPPVGAMRAQRIARLPESVRPIVALDSMRAIDDIAAAACAADRPIGVYVELDLGMHRVGTPDLDAAIALARAVVSRPPLELDGIAFYPGHIREPVDAQESKQEELAARLGDVIGAFAAAGVEPRVVSGGSTPTMWHTHEIPGVTEFRPGTYVYNDRTTALIGACGWDDCAFTVLATVISTAVPGQAVIDAGTKSLGREPLRGADTSEGFGSLLEHPEVFVRAMSEEHGILELRDTSWKPSVGERVRVVPNHVCIVTHLNDFINGVRGEEVVERWRVEARGR